MAFLLSLVQNETAGIAFLGSTSLATTLPHKLEIWAIRPAEICNFNMQASCSVNAAAAGTKVRVH
jgi:hypothetical protein